jgi:hypothetical protein
MHMRLVSGGVPKWSLHVLAATLEHTAIIQDNRERLFFYCITKFPVLILGYLPPNSSEGSSGRSSGYTSVIKQRRMIIVPVKINSSSQPAYYKIYDMHAEDSC